MRIEKDCGFIEYDLPDVADAMILLGKMGVDPGKKKTDEEINEDLVYIGKLMKQADCYVTKLNLQTNSDEKITKYKDALKYFEFMEILSEMAAEIAKSLQVDAKKKQSSNK